MRTLAREDGIAALLVGLLALGLYMGTAAAGWQLDDAAELALCARHWSSAHPPGYALWTTLAHAWGLLAGYSPRALTVCSALPSALGLLLLTRAVAHWLLAMQPQWSARKRALVAGSSSAVLATSPALWAWGNSVEVYGLQILATACVLLAVARAARSSLQCSDAWLLGLGVGVGLSNHHLGMVALLPWLPWWLGQAVRPLRRFWRVALLGGLVALAVLLLASALLLLRAQVPVRYSFGEPATLARWWFHLRGGFFADLLGVAGVDYAGRTAVYLSLWGRTLGLGWLLAGLGMVVLWRHSRRLALAVVLFPLTLTLVSLTRAYVPNMDATVASGMMAFALPLALGLGWLSSRGLWLAALLLPLLNLWLNWSSCNRVGYAPGDDLLASLDASLPPDAVLLASAWETQTLPWLAQEEANWRADVSVLPGSIKGTNAPLFARRNPELHQWVALPYAQYLAAIEQEHAGYAHTDYFQFTQPATWQAYDELLAGLLAACRNHQRPVLLDKGMLALLLQRKLVHSGQVHACGGLFAVGEVQPARAFPAPGPWLAHAMLARDFCAFGALHELLGSSQQIDGYWRSRGRSDLAAAAQRAAQASQQAWTTQQEFLPKPRRRVP